MKKKHFNFAVTSLPKRIYQYYVEKGKVNGIKRVSRLEEDGKSAVEVEFSNNLVEVWHWEQLPEPVLVNNETIYKTWKLVDSYELETEEAA